jgi:hypothetical protein
MRGLGPRSRATTSRNSSVRLRAARRAILERFREQYGEYSIVSAIDLPCIAREELGRFIEAATKVRQHARVGSSDQQHPARSGALDFVAPLAFGPKVVVAVEIEFGRERSLRCGVFDRCHSHGSR